MKDCCELENTIKICQFLFLAARVFLFKYGATTTTVTVITFIIVTDILLLDHALHYPPPLWTSMPLLRSKIYWKESLTNVRPFVGSYGLFMQALDFVL